MKHIKSPITDAEAENRALRATVEEMLERIAEQGEPAALEFAQKLDGWEGDVVLSNQTKQQLISQVSERDKEDIRFAYKQVQRFAQAQRDSLREFEIETEPGVRLGQRVIPVQCAGCYVPGYGAVLNLDSSIRYTVIQNNTGVKIIGGFRSEMSQF